MLGKLFVALLLVAGLVVWAQKDFRTVNQQPASVAEAYNENFVAEGVVISYQSSDIPTYFLLYETEDGSFLRKELRFTSARGCNIQAGDLPCATTRNGNLLPVALGTYVRVTGVKDAQRVVVESIEEREDHTGSFSTVSLRVGETATAGDVEITLMRVYAESGCELFLGCYGEDIPRVLFRTEVSGDTSQARLIPGMIKTTSGTAIVPLTADVEGERAEFVIARGQER